MAICGVLEFQRRLPSQTIVNLNAKINAVTLQSAKRWGTSQEVSRVEFVQTGPRFRCCGVCEPLRASGRHPPSADLQIPYSILGNSNPPLSFIVHVLIPQRRMMSGQEVWDLLSKVIEAQNQMQNNGRYLERVRIKWKSRKKNQRL